RWHAQSCDNFVDEVSIKIVMQQASLRLVIAVTDQQAWRVVASIQSHAVRRIELLQPIAFGPEVHQIFSSPVKFENGVAGIAIGQKNIPVGGHCDGCGSKLFQLKPGFLWKWELQD